MGWQEKYDKARELEQRAEQLRQEARVEQHNELKAQPLFERLVFSAETRCPCGAGLAYDPAAEDDPGAPFRGPSYWDCSSILLGTAIPSGQEGSVTHTGRLPFVFYEIKSERQPSAGGATTRPPEAPKPRAA